MSDFVRVTWIPSSSSSKLPLADNIFRDEALVRWIPSSPSKILFLVSGSVLLSSSAGTIFAFPLCRFFHLQWITIAVTIAMMMTTISTGMIISATGKLDVSSGSGGGVGEGGRSSVIEELSGLTQQLNSMQILHIRCTVNTTGS